MVSGRALFWCGFFLFEWMIPNRLQNVNKFMVQTMILQFIVEILKASANII